MAIDMFLKIGNISGESLDQAHKGWVDVLAWSWGMSNSGTTQVGGGAGTGRPSFQDLSYTSYLDASTTPLMRAVATGQHLKSASLNVRRAGSAPTEFLKITLTEVLVTSLSTGGSGGEDRLTQNVTLNFAKFKVEYQQASETGKPINDPLVFQFDIAAANVIP
jgi:type VI secretion system secreted protein Hcp